MAIETPYKKLPKEKKARYGFYDPPTGKYYHCRVRHPDSFTMIRTVKVSKRTIVRVGKLRKDGKWYLQSILYRKKAKGLKPDEYWPKPSAEKNCMKNLREIRGATPDDVIKEALKEEIAKGG